MQTLKRAVIILALLIPFSIITFPTNFPSPSLFSALSLTLNTDTDTIVRGLTSLFPVQSAEAYTYQDVDNAYNNAKTQYPNDYIWIEEFNQEGQKGYKV